MGEDETQLGGGEQLELDCKQKIKKLSDVIDELKELFEIYDTKAQECDNSILLCRMILCFTDMIPKKLLFVQGLVSFVCFGIEYFRRKLLNQIEMAIFAQTKRVLNLDFDVEERFKKKSWLQYTLYLFKAFYRLFRKESPLKRSVGEFVAEAKSIRRHRLVIHSLSIIWSLTSFVFCILLYAMSDMERKSRVINGVALAITFVCDFSLPSFRIRGESFLEGLRSNKSGLKQRELKERYN